MGGGGPTNQEFEWQRLLFHLKGGGGKLIAQNDDTELPFFFFHFSKHLYKKQQENRKKKHKLQSSFCFLYFAFLCTESNF